MTTLKEATPSLIGLSICTSSNPASSVRVQVPHQPSPLPGTGLECRWPEEEDVVFKQQMYICWQQLLYISVMVMGSQYYDATTSFSSIWFKLTIMNFF